MFSCLPFFSDEAKSTNDGHRIGHVEQLVEITLYRFHRVACVKMAHRGIIDFHPYFDGHHFDPPPTQVNLYGKLIVTVAPPVSDL
jgi:hypothetical protein